MESNPTIRISTPADRDAILDFIARMGFNPRDAATWDALQMLAMTAWIGGRLVGAIPIEPRSLRIAPDHVISALHETVVAVDPDHRAAGIGSQLQRAIVEQPPADARIVTVFREEPQSPAYRWYMKNGFLPVLEIESWLCDAPGKLARAGDVRHWNGDDPAIPWIEVESAWRHASHASAGGTVDRDSRRLRDWLAVHPYRNRYAFHIIGDDIGGYALLGVGTMHSQTVRGDVLEMMPRGNDPSAAESLIRAMANVAARESWRPLRISLARRDPRVSLVKSLGFSPRWAFDMLARPLARMNLNEVKLANWRYAGIDYA